MQQTTTISPGSDVPELGRGDREHRCYECGTPIMGIETGRPGEHRFVGCGHPAGARFVEPPGTAGPTLLGFHRVGRR